MAFLSGDRGTLRVGGATVLHVTRWQIERRAQNKAYVANDTGGARRRVAGVRDCSGRLEIQATGSQQAPLAEGDVVTLALHVDDSGANYYELSGIVDAVRVEVDISAGTPVAYQIDFSASGPVAAYGVLNRMG